MDINSIMSALEAKHPGENEYLQAVREVLISVADVYNQHPEFEKNKIEEDNLRFLEFLQSGPYVKNHLSSFSGRICEVHAPRDYKWFAFSVAYSDSEKKKYSVDTKARFLELFEVDEEKVFAEEFHKM